MMQDVFGQPTSLARVECLDDWNAAQLGFLAHAAATPKHLAAVLNAEPDFALGQAAKGLFMLLLGRSELRATAIEALESARRAAANTVISQRERGFVDALQAWIGGSATGAVAHLEKVLDRHPDDPLAMKVSQAIRFVLGDCQGMRRSVERVMPAYGPDHAARGYLLGCHAFALEETGEYERAEIAGRQALWMAPDDAWGLHAVAHVHDMTCDASAGLDWLTGREAAWAHCNNFRYHVWWHKALMHLDLGDVDAVFDLYDSEIRKDKTDDYRDISNATSLLVRLQLEGCDVGDRWDELAEFSASRTEDGSLIFADLHYLLALVATGREEAAGRLVNRIGVDAARGSSDSEMRMAEPGLNAARGLQAFGDGRYAAAFSELSAARNSMQLAGGSHAQRDVFERLTIDAGLRAGLWDAVERILNDRRQRRAGRDDAFSAMRRDLIASGRDASGAARVPAQ